MLQAFLSLSVQSFLLVYVTAISSGQYLYYSHFYWSIFYVTATCIGQTGALYLRLRDHYWTVLTERPWFKVNKSGDLLALLSTCQVQIGCYTGVTMTLIRLRRWTWVQHHLPDRYRQTHNTTCHVIVVFISSPRGS